MKFIGTSIFTLALALSAPAMACDCASGTCSKKDKMACEGKEKKCDCGDKKEGCACKEKAKKS